jgi:hypothetical protein
MRLIDADALVAQMEADAEQMDEMIASWADFAREIADLIWRGEYGESIHFDERSI